MTGENGFTIEADLDDSEGEYQLRIELVKEGNYNSREEAEQHARKLKKALEEDSATDMFDVGRHGVRRMGP